MTKRISAAKVVREFGVAAPVARIKCGEEVVVEVRDGGDNLFSDAPVGTTRLAVEEVEWSRILPLTGPISVESARPGDTLIVEVHNIDVGDRTWTAFLPKMSRLMLSDELDDRPTLHVSTIDNMIAVDSRLRIPVRPMIGCIGVAPTGPGVSARTPGSFGGNMDANVIRAGATVYLPVAHKEALLALGDLHASMGDGEVGGSGAECAGEVTIACGLIRGRQRETPIVETDDAWYVIGSGWSMEDATRRALRSGFRSLTTTLGLEVANASILASLACDLEICQVVNPTITMRLKIPKSVMEPVPI